MVGGVKQSRHDATSEVRSSFLAGKTFQPAKLFGLEVRQMARWLKREEGQGMVEYGLIIALVAIVVIAVLTLLGPAIGNIFSSIIAAL